MLDPSLRTHPRVRGTTRELDQRARELRAEMTPAERRLWDALRDRQLAGLKFRRQHAIGTHILDFYCASCRLNVEVDGDIHDVPEQAEHDAVRDEYLRLSGPELSYWMHLDKHGNPRWLDRAAKPPSMMSTEPDTGRWQRISASAISWLPVESQL